MTSELIVQKVAEHSISIQDAHNDRANIHQAISDLTNAFALLAQKVDKAIVSINKLTVRLDKHELNTEHKDEWECAECQYVEGGNDD